MVECPMCHHLFNEERKKRNEYKNEVIDELIEFLDKKKIIKKELKQ